MAVETRIDLYDEDLLNIERVLLALNEKVGTRRNYTAFEMEIKERFDGIGLKVTVDWYEYAVQGQKVEGGAMPEVTIVDRVTPETQFDHDKLKHEVVNNLLELPGQRKGELLTVDNDMIREAVAGHKKAHATGDCHSDEE
jgi:hypothetical protein